jgi:hypothetical protein
VTRQANAIGGANIFLFPFPGPGSRPHRPRRILRQVEHARPISPADRVSLSINVGKLAQQQWSRVKRTSEEDEVLGDLWMIRPAVNPVVRDPGPRHDLQVLELFTQLFDGGLVFGVPVFGKDERI